MLIQFPEYCAADIRIFYEISGDAHVKEATERVVHPIVSHPECEILELKGPFLSVLNRATAPVLFLSSPVMTANKRNTALRKLVLVF